MNKHEEMKQKYTEYNHSERGRQRKNEYRKRNLKKAAEYQKKYYHEHHDEQLAYHQQRRAENPEQYNAIAKRRQAKVRQLAQADPEFAQKRNYQQLLSWARTFINNYAEMTEMEPEAYLTDLQVYQRRVAELRRLLAAGTQDIPNEAHDDLKLPYGRKLASRYTYRLRKANNLVINPYKQREQYQKNLLQDNGATYAKDLADISALIDTAVKYAQDHQK